MNRSVEDLKKMLELLHSRGIQAWAQLKLWKKLSDFLALRPEIFQMAGGTWTQIQHANLALPILTVSDMLGSKNTGGLSVRSVLNTAECHCSKKIWSLTKEQLVKAIERDRQSLDRWEQELDSVLNYRDRKIAHYDKKHIDGLPDYDIYPSKIRDALYDFSKVLNRYSGALKDVDTLHTWHVEGLDNFGSVGRVLELGYERRSELLNSSGDIATVDANLNEFDNDWEQQGRLTMTEEIREDREENQWKWKWLE